MTAPTPQPLGPGTPAGVPSPSTSGRRPAGPVRSTVVVGLLGGIASGKSLVGRLLAGEDGVVIDADALAHRVLEEPEVVRLVAAHFGPAVLNDRGLPERRLLAERVFRDPAERARLESWIHPRVRANIQESLSTARADRVPIAVLDVPLLLENQEQHGLLPQCDALVFVEAELGERERRAAKTRAWGPGELARREAAQLSLDEKQRRADHVVRNSGSTQELTESVAALRRWLLQRPAQ